MMDGRAPIRSRSRSGGIAAGLIAAVLIAAVLVGVGAGVGLHSLLARSAPAATRAAAPAITGASASNALQGQATWTAGARAAPAITTLRDQTGRLFALRSVRGRTVAMTFFDSHCNQACPLEGRVLAEAERSLPAGRRPVLVVVSVNPLDTPASARRAAESWGLAAVAPWHWLMGTHAQLARVWAAYHIYVAAPEHGDISHTAALYLIDRRGFERSAYLYPFVPRFVTADLRTLAPERRS